MSGSTYGARVGAASFREAQRILLDGAGGGEPLSEPGAALEMMSAPAEQARLISSDVIEGTTLRARPVVGEPTVGFSAFLDGTQQSRVVHYARGLPIVFGTVAAVIRVRINRRMVTWRRPLVASALYVPKTFLPVPLWSHAERAGFRVVDTTASPDEDRSAIAHPLDLLERAVHAVQRDRERSEQELAESWCSHERSPLYIDGSVSKSDVVAASTCTVGVVKSHRTLYLAESALHTVLGMPHGYRSSVFRVTSRSRNPVASWYLRVRPAAGRDPMWGLVRIEIAAPDPTAHPARLSDRADEISRWVLAESSPLALPDGRWDKMVYGIRDCEEYLRAIC